MTPKEFLAAAIAVTGDKDVIAIICLYGARETFSAKSYLGGKARDWQGDTADECIAKIRPLPTVSPTCHPAQRSVEPAHAEAGVGT